MVISLSQSSCRSGCKTQDHGSYSECLRAANVTVTAVMNSPLQRMYESTKKDLSAYKAARANGIQPEGTSLDKIREAETASRSLGRPYDANIDPPANMIVNKNTARFVNASD
jgi:hypothetical protein